MFPLCYSIVVSASDLWYFGEMKRLASILCGFMFVLGCGQPGCPGGGGSRIRALVGRLASDDASERAEAVSKLCAEKEGRQALASALASDVPLDVIVAAIGYKGCLSDLAVDAAILRLLTVYRLSDEAAFRGRVNAWWRTLPVIKRGALLGMAARFDLRTRKQYSLGATARVRLLPAWPADLPGAGDMWLRASKLTATVNGKDLHERRWPLGRRFEMTTPLDLDLATLTGPATTAAGHYEIELRFAFQVFESAAKSAAGGAPLFSGEISAGPASFEVAARRPDEFIQAVDDPRQDPSSKIEISLNALGHAVEVYPAMRDKRELSVDRAHPTAEIILACKSKLTIGLAYAVMAINKDQKPHQIGWLASKRLDGKQVPRVAGTLDLRPIMPADGRLVVQLKLTPSVNVAYRDPEIESYWNKSLDLGEIIFSTE